MIKQGVDHPSDDDDGFNERLVQDLLKRLNGPVQIPLSSSDKAHLATIVEGTFEVSDIPLVKAF